MSTFIPITAEDRRRLWHPRGTLCAVCRQPTRGFGWFDPHRSKRPRPSVWFCSMSCQSFWTRLAREHFAMVDLTEEERAACGFRTGSPLTDTRLPDCDALWLPGGYPELHAARLAANTAMRDDIRRFFVADRPILAECGGMLYALESLTDHAGQTHAMLGLLPGHGAMRGRRGCQGMQTAELPEGEVRGHAHHRSQASGTPEPIAHGRAFPGDAARNGLWSGSHIQAARGRLALLRKLCGAGCVAQAVSHRLRTKK